MVATPTSNDHFLRNFARIGEGKANKLTWNAHSSSSMEWNFTKMLFGRDDEISDQTQVIASDRDEELLPFRMTL